MPILDIGKILAFVHKISDEKTVPYRPKHRTIFEAKNHFIWGLFKHLHLQVRNCSKAKLPRI